MDSIFKQGTVVFKFFKQFEAELLADLAKQPLPIPHFSISPVDIKPYCGYISIVFGNQPHHPAGEIAYACITTSGEVHDRRRSQDLYPHNIPVYRLITDWGEYVRNRFHAAERMKEFWKESKEELVAAAWHPERVAKWLEAGIDVEAM